MLLTDKKDFMRRMQEENGIHDTVAMKVDYMRNRKAYGNAAHYFIKNTPSYLEDNVVEWMEGKPLSGTEVEGTTVRQIMAAHDGMGFLDALDAAIMLHNEFLTVSEVLSKHYEKRRRKIYPAREDVLSGRIILIGKYSIDKRVRLCEAAQKKLMNRFAETGLFAPALYEYTLKDCLPELEPNLLEYAKGEKFSDIMVGNLSVNMLWEAWTTNNIRDVMSEMRWYKKCGCKSCFELHVLNYGNKPCTRSLNAVF